MSNDTRAAARNLEIAAGLLFIMKFVFSLDWPGLMNLLSLGVAALLFFDRPGGKIFPMLIIGVAALQLVDVLTGFMAILMQGGAVLLLIRTLLLGAFIIMFLLRFFGNKLSGKILLISALVCSAADLLLSVAAGCVDMPVLGQSALTFGLASLCCLQREEGSEAAFLSKTGFMFLALCLITMGWGLGSGTGGDCAVSSLYKIFEASAAPSRSIDLMHLLPGVNWNLYGGLAGAALGGFMIYAGRRA